MIPATGFSYPCLNSSNSVLIARSLWIRFQSLWGAPPLLELVVKVSKSIGAFVKDVRQARRDMEAVSRELVSLNIVLELLAEDTKQGAVKLPQTLSRQVSTIVSKLHNCGSGH